MTEGDCVFCDLTQFRAADVCIENAFCLYAKAAQDERLAPDGYALIWNCFSEVGQPPNHAHLHVIPRFDDEPLADRGGRSAIKVPENRRPDPSRRGSGRAQSFGRVAPR
jgi:diadenosine tetraphosphate (Ap4A) HIT family hydrolase